MVDGEFSELNGPNTGNHVLQRPLTPQNVEKLQTRGTNVCAVGSGIRDLAAIQIIEKLWVNKVGMIC